ncbi:TetR family transcriptional regulator C-terminal domain-containing protein [Lachnospiraceae bacterium ZAX-1]
MLQSGKKELSDKDMYCARYYSNGIVGMAKQWILNKMNHSLEQLASWANEFMSDYFRKYLSQ